MNDLQNFVVRVNKTKKVKETLISPVIFCYEFLSHSAQTLNPTNLMILSFQLNLFDFVADYGRAFLESFQNNSKKF